MARRHRESARRTRKPGCDAADFIFDIPSLDCREMPDVIVRGVPLSLMSKKLLPLRSGSLELQLCDSRLGLPEA